MTDDAANEALDALSSCQCCLLGGQQRSFKTLYFHMGKTEIYSDMLKECFDIRLSVGSEKAGICLVCVGYLRDASNFKQQVQHSQAELRRRLKRALGILEEEPEPVAAVKWATDEAKTSYILLDEESAVELSDDEGVRPVLCEGQVKSEETDEDGTSAAPPDNGTEPFVRESDSHLDGFLEEPAAVFKSEIDEDDDGTNGNLSDDGHSIKSEKPDDDATSDEDLSPACSLSARARQQLAMTCSVRLERLNGLEAHACHICHMTFEQESSLATHMMQHHDNQIEMDTYICDVCKQQFTLKGDLDWHISTHAREKPFNCEICYKSFSCRKHVRQHVVMHNAQKPFKCEICYKSFSWNCNFKRHVRIHDAQKTLKCEICYKSFSCREYLGKHALIHNTQKPFKCEICYKSFSCREYLGRHVRIHNTQKPFKCEICYKSFSRRCDLKRHAIIHTGGKPYSCDMCNRQFAHKSSIRKHVNFTLHAFKCNICNKQFARKKEFITHVNIHTGQMPMECQMPNELSPEEKHLNTHLRIE